MDATQQKITSDDDSTIEELQRQLERMRKEIDKHRRRRTMTRKIVYYAVAKAKKGKPGIYMDYQKVKEMKPIEYKKFDDKNNAIEFLRDYARLQRQHLRQLQTTRRSRMECEVNYRI